MSNSWFGFAIGMAVLGWGFFLITCVVLIQMYHVARSHKRLKNQSNSQKELLEARTVALKHACTTLLTMLYDLVLTDEKDDLAYKAQVIHSSIFLDGMINRSDYSVDTLQAVLATMDTAEVDDIVSLIQRISAYSLEYDVECVSDTVTVETRSMLRYFLHTVDEFFDIETEKESIHEKATKAVEHDTLLQEHHVQIKESKRAEAMLV